MPADALKRKQFGATMRSAPEGWTRTSAGCPVPEAHRGRGLYAVYAKRFSECGHGRPAGKRQV